MAQKQLLSYSEDMEGTNNFYFILFFQKTETYCARIKNLARKINDTNTIQMQIDHPGTLISTEEYANTNITLSIF